MGKFWLVLVYNKLPLFCCTYTVRTLKKPPQQQKRKSPPNVNAYFKNFREVFSLKSNNLKD